MGSYAILYSNKLTSKPNQPSLINMLISLIMHGFQFQYWIHLSHVIWLSTKPYISKSLLGLCFCVVSHAKLFGWVCPLRLVSEVYTHLLIEISMSICGQRGLSSLHTCHIYCCIFAFVLSYMIHAFCHNIALSIPCQFICSKILMHYLVISN